MGPTRRDLLRAAAASPFLLSGCSRSPDWFPSALRQIRDEGRPGVVLRLPKDPARRCRIGHALARVSTDAVILCLEEETAAACLLDAPGGDELLRIDGDGRVLHSVALLPDAPLREGLARLLGVYRLDAAKPAGPYGVSLGPASGCSEGGECGANTCDYCGMASAGFNSREFIRFLAR